MRTRLYFSAYHRSTLDDCLSTEQSISYELFHILIKNKVYHFYGYDNRIKCNRYIIFHIDKNVGFPTWLHEYYVDDYVQTRRKYQT